MEFSVLPGQTPTLGDLEKAVLDDLWDHASGDVKAVHQRVGVARGISQKTVQSTLERLRRKHLLSREKISHAYVHTARVRREELMGAMIADLVASLGQVKSGAMLSAFVDFAVRADLSNLDRLEELFAASRAEHDMSGDLS